MGVRRIFSSENPSSICRETDGEIGGGAEEREVGFCNCRERLHARTFLGLRSSGPLRPAFTYLRIDGRATRRGSSWTGSSFDICRPGPTLPMQARNQPKMGTGRKCQVLAHPFS